MQLSQKEQQTAREAGFGILADAFGGPRPHGIAPGRNADLDGRASGYGAAGAEVGGGSLSDPRSETEGLSGEVADHRRLTRERYDPTEVDRSHDRHRGEAAAFGVGASQDMRAQKRDQYAQLIKEQAMLPRPYPQVAADEVGGLLTGLTRIRGVGEGRSQRHRRKLRRDCADWERGYEAALRTAGSGWQEARDALIDTRMDQVRGYGLTDVQMAFFRAASELFLPAGVHDLLGTDTSRADSAGQGGADSGAG